MLNKSSRFILTASSVSPVCGTVSFLVWVKRDQKTWNLSEHLLDLQLNSSEYLFLISMALLIFSMLLFCITFQQAKKREIWGYQEELKIKTIKSKNSEMSSYLLGYLFPLISGGDLFSNIYIALFFYVIMFWAIWYSDTYGFNPVLAVLKYKFYEVETESGIGLTIITKKTIKNPEEVMEMVQLTDYAYMQVR